MPTDSSRLSERYQITKRVTLVGAGVNTLLALAQLLGGFFTQSQGLIADGLHTVSDLASDFIVLVAAREAHRAADNEHPYGHGRIETIATSILGITLIIVATGIAVDVLERLRNPERLLQPQPLALVFALLAVV
ncbi:MAG TPA: cation diffusion facilitator family transporter, partial [Gammaproteobacteria bacterium]|nr:cation diffusion facilitator family transporter [Gammaproteobacteria bacterium]